MGIPHDLRVRGYVACEIAATGTILTLGRKELAVCELNKRVGGL